MKKFLFLMFSCLFSSLIKADVLFIKKNGEAISQQEYNTLYPIMLKHQFPTNIMFGSYADDELAAMRDDVKKELPANDIEVLFIPKTLYEILFLTFIQENFDKIEQVTDGILSRNCQYGRCNVLVHLRSPLINSNDDWWNIWIKILEPGAYAKIIQNSQIIQLHFILNNYIIKTFKKQNFSTQESLESYLKILKTIDCKLLSKLIIDITMQEPTCHSACFSVDYISKNILEQAVKIEYHAYKTGHCVLYRGTGNSKLDMNQLFFLRNPQCKRAFYTISLGSTLFGGTLYGLNGSCAYDFIKRYKNGYAVLIDRKEYMNKGITRDMFFIPPLTTLLNVLGTSEFFHSRSKVPDITETTCHSFGTDYENQRIRYPELLEINAETPEKAHEIFDMIPQYIRDNHIDIKV